MQSVLQEFNIKLQLEKEESLVKTQKGLLSSFWSENATTLVKDFTYHKLTHSKGVLKKILTIVKNVDLELSSDDYFILAMSALLHDIGMSIDILIHDDIQQCAIKNYHATHEPSKLIAADPNFQKYIRDNHNALSAAYCDLKLDISLDILSKEQKQAIIDCCLYHRNLNESFFTVEAINKLTKNQLLVALFRMGDELDIGTERISQGEQTAFNRPAESESYWELNKREKITISASNDVKLNIYVNNEDSNRHNINKLMNGVISDFNKKNGGLFAILCRLGVRISFNVFDSGVETVDRLDDQELKQCPQNFVTWLSGRLTETAQEEEIRNKMILYERSLEGGMEVLKNNATVLFYPNDKKYVFFIYKALKILDSDRGYRGQVLCQKAQEVKKDSQIYKNLNRLSLLDTKGPSGQKNRRCIKFEAYTRKRQSDGNWSIYRKTKCEETANGLGFLRFLISFERDDETNGVADLGYSTGDEIGVLYKYEIPLEYWGNFLRRTISCFYEDAMLDLIMPIEYKDRLNRFECELFKGSKDGKQERKEILDPPVAPDDVVYSETWLGKQKIIEWNKTYCLLDDAVVCFSYKLPVEDMRRTKFRELYPFKLYWDANKIFDKPGEKQTNGTGISAASNK